jgi:uncharacterized protein (TIGR04255 family)
MTTQTPHLRYPRPTIVEALCEIHFRPPEGQEWSAGLTGRFFRRVQDEFPELEPDQVIGVDVMIGPEGREQRTLRPRLRTRFRHRARPLLLQLSEHIFTVNVLAPYPGWQQVRDDVLSAWAHLLAELTPTAITRVGLRYINRLPRSSDNERATDWLIPSQYFAPGALEALPGSSSRVEAWLSEEAQLVIALGYQPSDNDLAHGAIILDLDRIDHREMVASPDALGVAADALHNDIWQAFASAKGERLERYLRGDDR